jgi:hypothetical protein
LQIIIITCQPSKKTTRNNGINHGFFLSKPV